MTRSAMKARWVLLVVLLVACGGRTLPAGTDTEPVVAKVDILDVVAELARRSSPGPDVIVADHGGAEEKSLDWHPEQNGGYMDPCSDGPMCETGLCAPWDDPKSEGFCTRICTADEECGEGLTCPPPVGFAEDYDCADGASCVCLSSTMFLCKSCDQDEVCSSPASPSTRGYCLPRPGPAWGYCASDCDSSGPCPPGYTCKPVHIGSEDVTVCVPEVGDCAGL